MERKFKDQTYQATETTKKEHTGTWNIFRSYIWAATKVNCTIELHSIDDFRRLVQFKTNGCTKIQPLPRKHRDYILFFINAILTILMTSKSLFYSIVAIPSDDFDDEQAGIGGGENAQLNRTYTENVIHTLGRDIFGSEFASSRTVNFIVTCLLLPATITRTKHLVKYFRRHLSKSMKCASYLSDTISIAELDLSYLYYLSAPTGVWKRLLRDGWFHKHPLDDLSGGQSLLRRVCAHRSSSRLNISRSARRKATSGAEQDLMTKMYFHNMIYFDDCYKQMFKPAVDYLSHHTHKQTIHSKNLTSVNSATKKRRGSRSSRSVSGSSSIKRLHVDEAGDDDEISLQMSISTIGESNSSRIKSFAPRDDLDESLKLDPNHKNYVFSPDQVGIFNPHHEPKDELRKNIGKQPFISKPFHRCDQTEMAWLVALVILFYVMTIGYISSLYFFYSCHLIKLKNFADVLDFNLVLSRLEKFNQIGSFLVASIQLNLLLLLVVLSIIDLYSFFAVCVICYSRARYLRIHLERLCKLCSIIGHLNGTDHQDQSSASPFDEYSKFIDKMYRIKTIIQDPEAMEEFPSDHIIGIGGSILRYPSAAIALRNDVIRTTAIGFRSRRNRKANKPLTLDLLYIIGLNERIEYILELLLLIQNELADIKLFFSTYLSLEITFRALSVVFSVLALLDNRGVYQVCFLIGLFISGFVPIVIVLTTAAFVESEFGSICKTLSWILYNGKQMVSSKNIRIIMATADFLCTKSNRSFIIVGNFSLTLGSLLPVVAWIATGVVILRH